MTASNTYIYTFDVLVLSELNMHVCSYQTETEQVASFVSFNWPARIINQQVEPTARVCGAIICALIRSTFSSSRI